MTWDRPVVLRTRSCFCTMAGCSNMRQQRCSSAIRRVRKLPRFLKESYSGDVEMTVGGAIHAVSKGLPATQLSCGLHTGLHTVCSGSRAVHYGGVDHLHRKLRSLPLSSATVSARHWY